MTMDDVRTEIQGRQCRDRGLGKERELFDILIDVAIGFRSGEIIFIINKVKLHALIFHLQDAYILTAPCQVHIEMGHILHLILPLLTDAHILRNHYPDIVLLFVKIFRQ